MSLVDDYVEMLTTPTQKNQNAIVKGGKTEQSFVVPFGDTEIEFIVITYSQCGKIVMRKLINDVTIIPENSEGTSSIIYYSVSESESMRFKVGKKVEVQIKLNLYNEELFSNTPATSSIFKLDVIGELDDALVSDEQDDVSAIEVFNIGRKLEALNFHDLVTKNNNLQCRFLLDSFWRGNITAIFKDEYGDVVKVPLLTSYCYIPDIILLKPGKINIGVEMEDIDSEGCVISSEWSNSIRVRMGCCE